MDVANSGRPEAGGGSPISGKLDRSAYIGAR